MAELDKIQQPSVAALLHALGYSKKTPRAMAFGPDDDGGIGIRHLLPEQGTGSSLLLLGYLRADSFSGKYARTALNWLQLWAGQPFSILEDTKTLLSYLPANWFTVLRSFLLLSDIHLDIHDIYKVKTRRKNDTILMAAAAKLYKSKTTLELINRERLYRQVECISDLASADGQFLRSTPTSKSKKLWPKQVEPGPKTDKIWRTFLETFIGNDSGRLRQPLGPWHNQPNQWPAYYDAKQDGVLLEKGQEWTFHRIIRKHRRYWDIDLVPAYTSKTIDDHAIPIDRQADPTGRFPNRYELPNAWIPTPPPTILPPQTDFQSYVKTLQTWDYELLRNVELMQSGAVSLLELLLNPNASVLAATDGGIKDPHGYFGWAIGTDDCVVCHNSGTVFGWPHSSFRAEGYGRLSLLRFLHHIVIYFFGEQRLDFPAIQCFCDNTSIIKVENELSDRKWTPSTVLRADYDMVKQIELAKQECPIPQYVKWVKGHQDTDGKYEDLSRPSQLNIIADNLATRHRLYIRNLYPKERIEGPALPACNAVLYHNNQRITGYERRTLRSSWAAKQYKKYIITKHKWTEGQYDLMNWPVYQSARRCSPRHLKKFVNKLQTNWLPTNTRLHTIYGTSPDCCSCLHPETINHLYQCPTRSEWRVKFLKELEQLLDKHGTEPTIKKTILQALRLEITDTDRRQRPVNLRTQTTSLLTWVDFIQGRLDSHWEWMMDDYYYEFGIRTMYQTGKLWSRRIIIFMWEQLYELWLFRNDIQHAKDNNDKMSFQRQEATKNIRTYYDYSPYLLARDRAKLLGQPLDELLRSKTYLLRDWIKTHEASIKRAIADAHTHHIRTQPDIREALGKDLMPP